MNTTPKEYRCTRAAPYGPGTPGFTDPTARQGHYIVARSEEGALAEMQRQFGPTDRKYAEPERPMFTVQLWKKSVPEWLTPVEDRKHDDRS